MVTGHCEGLGAVGERTFLEGTVASWLATRGGIVSAPDVIWSDAAAEATRRLSSGARGVPKMAMLGPIVALNGASTWISAGDGSGPEETFDANERELPGISLPTGPILVADAWVFPVSHWNQLVWANLLALGPRLWAALAGTGLTAAWRLGWASVRAGSTRPEDVAARLNRLDAGATIHRNATVEGCWLGRGARVGAGAVVRGCILGEGAVIEELALVEGAVLGRGARVQRLAMAKYQVIEEEAMFAGIAQLGVIGRKAVVKHGATLMDMAFGQAVRVRVGEGLVSAPFGLSGVCVGEGAVVASGVRVAPGRVIPAGMEILADPDGVLSRMDVPEGCRRAIVRGGALEPA